MPVSDFAASSMCKIFNSTAHLFYSTSVESKPESIGFYDMKLVVLFQQSRVEKVHAHHHPLLDYITHPIRRIGTFFHRLH